MKIKKINNEIKHNAVFLQKGRTKLEEAIINNMIKGKKALSHVEFIISLVIFLAFVIFMLAFLNPFKSNDTNPALLDILQRQITDYSKINVVTGTLIVNNSGSQDCFSVAGLSDKKVIVRKDGERINASNDGKNEIENRGTGVYNLYYSDDFNQNSTLTGCQELTPNQYNFGLTRNDAIISLDKINELAGIYNNRYADAKSAINFSGNNDFGFIVYDLNGTEITKAFKQKTSADINAREVNVQLIDGDANIKSVIINLRVW